MLCVGVLILFQTFFVSINTTTDDVARLSYEKPPIQRQRFEYSSGSENKALRSDVKKQIQSSFYEIQPEILIDDSYFQPVKQDTSCKEVQHLVFIKTHKVTKMDLLVRISDFLFICL